MNPIHAELIMQKEYLNNILALYAELRCQDRGRSVCAHAPGVRSCVRVIDALMVLVFRRFNNEKTVPLMKNTLEDIVTAPTTTVVRSLV